MTTGEVIARALPSSSPAKAGDPVTDVAAGVYRIIRLRG